MQLDIEGKGLAAIFKEWHVSLIDELFNRKLTSGEAHKFIVKHDIRAKGKGGRGPVSRASVCFFLSDMVDRGLLEYDEETAKGGHRRIYKMALTREEFGHTILGHFVGQLLLAFPDESQTFMWPRP